MRTQLILLSTLAWMTQHSSAQFSFGDNERTPTNAIASITIHPEDVVLESVQKVQMATNWFAVRWTYTEAGAKKMKAFREAHAGQEIFTQIGSYETPRSLLATNKLAKAVNIIPWERVRTDKVIGVNAAEAKTIVAGLQKP